MQWLETPDWLDASQLFGEGINEGDKRKLQRSWPHILQEVENSLRWAVVEDNPQAYLHPKDVGDCHGFCIGRRFYEKHTDNHFWIEVECCFMREMAKVGGIIFCRCIVTLYWNLNNVKGQLARCRVTGRTAQLSKLNYQRIGTFDLLSSEGFQDAEPEEQKLLIEFWPSVMARLEEFARQAVEDGCFSGELDDWGFPNLAELTGQFYIDGSTVGAYSNGICVMLRFLERQRWQEQDNFDYLGEEIGIELSDDGLSFAWKNTSVI